MPLSLQFGRRRWAATWPMTLLTVCAVVLFIELGRWQWHRAQHQRAQIEAFRHGAGPARSLPGGSTAELPRYARVRIRGRYDRLHQFLLDNMPQAGRTGYEVLTPLWLSDGRTLLVNRGWVPMPPSRRELPDLRFEPPESIDVQGRLDTLPQAGISLGHVPPPASGPWPRIAGFPTMTDLSSALGRPLESRQLLLDPDQPFGYGRDWQPATGGMTPERHLSYALQWWSFAALASGLYVVLNRRPAPPA